MRKLFIKKTVSCTNYTQLHHLGGLGSAKRSPNALGSLGSAEALALTAFSKQKGACVSFIDMN